MKNLDLTKNDIINIAKRKGVFSTPSDNCGWRRRIIIKCNELVREGVLRHSGKFRGDIHFRFISYPGCPKAIQAHIDSKPVRNSQFTTKSGVLALLEKRGNLRAMKKPLKPDYQSFAAHCKDLANKGVIEAHKEDREYVYYIATKQ